VPHCFNAPECKDVKSDQSYRSVPRQGNMRPPTSRWKIQRAELGPRLAPAGKAAGSTRRCQPELPSPIRLRRLGKCCPTARGLCSSSCSPDARRRNAAARRSLWRPAEWEAVAHRYRQYFRIP
jgi:hypothetical protein